MGFLPGLEWIRPDENQFAAMFIGDDLRRQRQGHVLKAYPQTGRIVFPCQALFGTLGVGIEGKPNDRTGHRVAVIFCTEIRVAIP